MNYVWDPNGAEVDSFAAELEHGLAPLDEAEALVDSLELDAASEPTEAVVLTLPHADASRVARARERSWPYLAAALVLLSASVLILTHDQRRRAVATAPAVEVVGASAVAGRVRLGVHAVSGDVTAYAVLVALRAAHDELAGCALELDPGAELQLRAGLRLDAGVREVELGALDHPALEPCLRAALSAFDATALGDEQLDLELDIHLQHHQSEERDE